MVVVVFLGIHGALCFPLSIPRDAAHGQKATGWQQIRRFTFARRSPGGRSHRLPSAMRLRSETEKLGGALAKLRVEHQAVKDELARLKHLPPRPPIKPSGMDKSTQAKGPEAGDEKGGRSSRRRGSQLDRLKIGAIIVVTANPPAGSRHKGDRRASSRHRLLVGAFYGR